MKRMDQINGSTLITVKSKEADFFRVVPKGHFERELKESRNSKEKVKKEFLLSKAEAVIAHFSFDNVLEYCGESDGMHEDWEEAVIQDLEDAGIDLKKIEKTINEVFKNNPTYIEGEPLTY